MKIKKIFFISLIFLFVLLVTSNSVILAATTDPIIAMQGMKDGGDTADSSSVTGKLGPIINAAIALIQVAGTGISLIMVTVLGIKYILASPSDKADVKKQITPMLTGAIILFGSVNLVQIIANFTPTIFE